MSSFLGGGVFGFFWGLFFLFVCFLTKVVIELKQIQLVQSLDAKFGHNPLR